jgi:cell division protein FtsB
MNKIIIILSLFLVVLLFKFTLGETSYFKYNQLKNKVVKIKTENSNFSEKIEIIKAEIKNLKTGLSVIEEKARNELGLIKEKETFYQILK